jgi:SNF2 family DNA or RNA helicase
MNKFEVNCERIKRQSKYALFHPFNIHFHERIKTLDSSERKYVVSTNSWVLTTKGLFELISHYKKSTKIHFNFGSPEARKIFIDQVNKMREKELEKKRLIKELEGKKKYWLEHKEYLDKNFKQYTEQTHKNLKSNVTLYPFQIPAVMFIDMVKNVLLAHEMGLGKTIISIAFSEMKKFEKVFVITPNSLKFNYFNEVEKFTNSKAHIVNWRKNKYSIDEAKYIIVNYEYFNKGNSRDMDKKFKELGVQPIDCLILDESHRIKNGSANTTKNIKRIFKDKIFRNGETYKIFMTGTPMSNRAEELYTTLHEISPLDFPTKAFFYEYYLGMKYNTNSEEDYGGYEKSGESKFLELYNAISPYVHRKKKEDVLKDLPEKTYQRIMLDMSPKEEERYCDIEAGVAEELFNTENINVLTIMLRLRQYTSQIKLNYIKEIIDNILLTGEKLVIIDMFKDILYEIQNIYPEISLVHTGDQSVEHRAQMVEQFQDKESKYKIFLATVQTANYGLTLTAASKMLILTLPYTVGEYDQVSDRIHRIKQLNKVNIYPVIFKDTIDQYVFSLIEAKRKEILAVIDNVEYVSRIEKSTVNEVVEFIKNKYKKN